MQPLTKRDPSGHDAVVMGASPPSNFLSDPGNATTIFSSSEAGSRLRSTAGTMRPESSTNTGVATKGPRHQLPHRLSVRAGTPVARLAFGAAICVNMTMLARMTTAPT